jgi:hypothetical protein
MLHSQKPSIDTSSTSAHYKKSSPHSIETKETKVWPNSANSPHSSATDSDEMTSGEYSGITPNFHAEPNSNTSTTSTTSAATPQDDPLTPLTMRNSPSAVSPERQSTHKEITDPSSALMTSLNIRESRTYVPPLSPPNGPISALHAFKYQNNLTELESHAERIKATTWEHQKKVLDAVMAGNTFQNFSSEEEAKNVVITYITHIWDENLEVLSFALTFNSFGIYYANEFTQFAKRTGSAVNNIFRPEIVAHIKQYGANVSFNVRHYDDLQPSGRKREFNFNSATIFIPICYTTNHALEREDLTEVIEFFYKEKKCNVIIYLGTDDGLESNVKLRDEWLLKNKQYIKACEIPTSTQKLTILTRADLVTHLNYLNAEKYFVDEIYEKKYLSHVLIEDVIQRLAKKNQIKTQVITPKNKPRASRSLFQEKKENKEDKEDTLLDIITKTTETLAIAQIYVHAMKHKKKSSDMTINGEIDESFLSALEHTNPMLVPSTAVSPVLRNSSRGLFSRSAPQEREDYIENQINKSNNEDKQNSTSSKKIASRSYSNPS